MDMKHYKYLLVLVAIVLASCSRFDVVDRVFDNSAYLNVSATDQTQLATFNNRINETSVSLAVQLAYPADMDRSISTSRTRQSLSQPAGSVRKKLKSVSKDWPERERTMKVLWNSTRHGYCLSRSLPEISGL